MLKAGKGRGRRGMNPPSAPPGGTTVTFEGVAITHEGVPVTNS